MSEYWINFFISVGVACGVFLLFAFAAMIVRKVHVGKFRMRLARSMRLIINGNG